jgi:isoamylase
VLGMFHNGQAILSRGPRGEEIEDDSFVLLFNAHSEDRQFTLPRPSMGRSWELELSTADPEAEPGSATYAAREAVDVMAHSITILKRTDSTDR